MERAVSVDPPYWQYLTRRKRCHSPDHRRPHKKARAAAVGSAASSNDNVAAGVQQPNSLLASLPDELLLHLLMSFESVAPLGSLAQTCRLMRRLCADETLWCSLYRSLGGARTVAAAEERVGASSGSSWRALCRRLCSLKWRFDLVKGWYNDRWRVDDDWEIDDDGGRTICGTFRIACRQPVAGVVVPADAADCVRVSVDAMSDDARVRLLVMLGGQCLCWVRVSGSKKRRGVFSAGIITESRRPRPRRTRKGTHDANIFAVSTDVDSGVLTVRLGTVEIASTRLEPAKVGLQVRAAVLRGQAVLRVTD